MRTALLAGVLLVGFAAPSFAQMQNGQQGQSNQQGQYNQRPGQIWRGDHDHDHDHWGHWHHFDHAERMGGTFYRFRKGDSEVDVHCPPNQPIQECVGGAIHLMQVLHQNDAPAVPSTKGQGSNG